MHKILVVNANWLGDAIFSTPVFRALKQAYPSAKVSCLCVPRVGQVLKYCPDVDEVIIYDEKGADRWPWRKLGLTARLRAQGFDAAFLLHRSLTRGLMVYWAGIPQRIGFGKARGLLTHPVQQAGDDAHRSDHYLRCVEAFGIAVSDRRCYLRLDHADARRLEEKLRARSIRPEDDLIVFNTGGNWDLKRWPLERWVELARQTAGRSSLKIVICGGTQDKKSGDEIGRQAGVEVANLAGETSIGESLALFCRAKAVVSADSGPLHLAGSVGANTVGIFGPTRPEITGPRGMGQAAVVFKEIACNKAPCYHLGCLNNVCMRTTGAEDVWQAAQKFAR